MPPPSSAPLRFVPRCAPRTSSCHQCVLPFRRHRAKNRSTARPLDRPPSPAALGGASAARARHTADLQRTTWGNAPTSRSWPRPRSRRETTRATCGRRWATTSGSSATRSAGWRRASRLLSSARGVESVLRAARRVFSPPRGASRLLSSAWRVTSSVLRAGLERGGDTDPPPPPPPLRLSAVHPPRAQPDGEA